MTSSIEPQHFKAAAPSPPRPKILTGVRVLVVEDDYYLAMDAKGALEAAGAEVVGPVSSLEQFQRTLGGETPDCAVVDINLGSGPTYAVAMRLEADGVPFMFLTGYSPDAILARFQHIPQARKPITRDELIQDVRQLCD